MVSSIQNIERLYDRNFLTLLSSRGPVAQTVASMRERLTGELSEEQTKALKQYTAFTNSVEQAFNQYRKEITGAAAAVAELKTLKESMFNTKMSPSQFEAALATYKSSLLRVRRLKLALMRRGFTDFGVESDGAAAFDRHWEAGGDDDPSARAQELIGQGMSPAEVADQMDAEGY
jgi:hypothetical protein